METKEYILTNITELLNRQGATNTSLRQMASYLDMSDGNLRYHFKTKEALITAILMQMIQEMEAVDDAEYSTANKLLEALRKELRTCFFTMYRYKFLFIEANLLFRQYDSFRKSFLDLMQSRKAYFSAYFDACKEKGLFHEQPNKADYEILIEQIFMISDNWIKYVEVERTPTSSIDKKIEHYINLCISLMQPLLSSQNPPLEQS